MLSCRAKSAFASPSVYRFMSRLSAAGLAAPLVLVPCPVIAQEAATALEQSGGLSEVVVSSYRFLSEDTSGATNLPLPVEKVPQAISLVSNDFIKAADLKNLGEIAQYTPGMVYSGAVGGSVSQISLRGFLTSYAFDGLTTGNILAEPDAALVDRVEVVKGPSSVVYGAASPGGVVNLVLKGAAPNTPTYLSILGGSWNRWRGEGQIAGALNESGTVRGIAVGVLEAGDSFTDYYESEKNTLYGGIDAALTDDLRVYVRVGREHVSRPGFGGFGLYADGTPPPISRDFILAPSDDRVVSDTYRASGAATWDVSPAWSLELKGNYSSTDHGGAAPLFATALQPNGNFNILTRNLDFELHDWNLGGFTNYKLDDLGLADSFLAASLIYTSSARTQRTLFPTINGLTTVPTNLLLGTDALVGLIDSEVFPGINPSLNQQQLYYRIASAQGVIKIVDSLSLLAGASVSDPTVKNKTVLNGPWVYYNPGSQTSYRAALMYEPVRDLNLYASYSQSFQPNFRTDRDDRVLPPVIGEEYEIGGKYTALDRRLLLTASYFQLDQKNTAVLTTFIGSDGFARYAAVGQVRHRGLELEAVGQVTDRWQIQAGITRLDPKITKDSVAANIGQTRPWIPKGTASAFTSYTFARGVSVAAGLRHVDSIKTSTLGTTRPLPSYTLVDGSVGMTLDTWQLQLNLKNAFDKTYYVNSAQSITGGTLFGEPRSVAVTVRKDF